MKMVSVIIMIFTGTIITASGTHIIDTMVAEIKKPRKGLAFIELATTPDPFFTVRKDVKATVISKPKKKVDLRLNGIVNNRAYINGVWHKEGDKVSGFILEYIGEKGIVLVDGEHVKRLFLHKQRKDIITIEERDNEKR